jgi:hypothetical protein
MSSKRWLRFWARAFPAENALRRDISVEEQNYYLELTPDEARAMDMRGMPLTVEHVNGIKTVEGQGRTPMKIDYHEKSGILGRVVDQKVTDKGAVLLLCEVGVGGEDETVPERVLKEATMALAKGGHYGVSLLHAFDQRYEAGNDEKVVRKYPVELSLTLNPRRENAVVFDVNEYDYPFSPEEKKYDVYRAGCVSTVNYGAVDRKDIANEIMSAANTTQTGAPKRQYTEDEIAKMTQEIEALRRENASMKPLADELTQRKNAEEEAMRQSAIKNVMNLNNGAKEMIKMMLEGNIPIPDSTRKAFEAIANKPEEEMKQVETAVSNIVSTANRNPAAPPAPTEMWKNFDVVMKSMMDSVVACGEINRLTQQQLQQQSSAVASSQRAAGLAGGAAVTSTPAKAQEPSWVANWEAVEARENARLARVTNN